MPASRNSQQPEEDVYDDGFLRVEHENYYLSVGGESILLPRKEFLLVSRLARTPGRIVPSTELWREVWGETPFNAESLHVHIYRLRRKLQASGVSIETMVNVGYRLKPAAHSEKI
jgi:two-component system alkaline phosphatase synthesis response regulator PhoP